MLFDHWKKDKKLQCILETVSRKNDESIVALGEKLERNLDEKLGKSLDEKLRQTMEEVLKKNMDEALKKTMDEELKKTVEEGLEKRLEEKLEQNREENSKLLRRQSGSLEDILEELQHQGEDKENVKKQLQEMRDRENALIELCCILAGQKEMILRQILAEGTFPENVRAGWQRQTELMKQEAEKYERQCAFREIGECGEKVDYECHQILSVCAAAEEEQSGTVAQVYAPGYSYHGQIIKKAQVSVYKMEERQSIEG